MGRRQPDRGRTELRTGAPAAAGAGPQREGPPRHWAEDLAERHLVAAGYGVLRRNYRLRGGEIDLVCAAPDGTYVFVEVRQRRSESHGGAAASLGPAKQRRVRAAAAHFLALELGTPDAHVRFDAVLVEGDEGRSRVRHVQDAF